MSSNVSTRDYEAITRDVYEAVLRPGDIAIDVGAHHGLHTLPMARCVAPYGRVYAVEPLPDCRDAIVANLLSNDASLLNVLTLLAPALYDCNGTATFHVPKAALPFAGLRKVPYPVETAVGTLSVETRTFDSLFLELPHLRYVKVDAEGAEWHIIRGALQSLNKFRPVVSFEFGTYSNRAYNIAPADMAVLWKRLGYTIISIEGESLTTERFIECANERRIWDYVAVPAEDGKTLAIVKQVLCFARGAWLGIRGELAHATAHAQPGTVVPPLRSFPAASRWLARLVARAFLYVARIITVPQAMFNKSIVTAVCQLCDDLQAAEAERLRQTRIIREMAQRLVRLESKLAELDAAARDGREHPTADRAPEERSEFVGYFDPNEHVSAARAGSRTDEQ